MKRDSILFVSDLDGTLLQSNETISDYSKQMLNQLIADGASFAVATGRSGATAAPLFEGVNLTLPLITLNGSTLFAPNAPQHSRFCQMQLIPYDISREILEIFRAHKACCLIYTVIQDQLHIYHDPLQNQAEQEFYESRKDLPLKTYHQQDLPTGQDTIFFSSILPMEVIKPLTKTLNDASFASEITLICYDDVYHKGYYFFEIHAKSASKRNAVLSMAKQLNKETIITFGDNLNDLSMMECADYCYAVGNAHEQIKKIATDVIGNHDEDAVVKKIAELFYQAE